MNNAATLDEIVFEKRNKDYGAYLLRKLYDQNILIAFGISSYLFVGILMIPLIKEWMKEEVVIILPPKKKTEVAIIDIPLDPKTPPPPPLPKIDPPQLKMLKFVPPVIVDDNKVDEPPPPPDDSRNKVLTGNENKEGTDDPDGMPPPDIETGKLGGLGETGDDEPWAGPITKDVSFTGGYISYIQKNISDKLKHYIGERGIKGKMILVITIGKEGAVKSVEVMAGKEIPNCKMCTEEVLNIIKNMPKWTPAENNGQPVVRRVSIPVVF